MVNPEQAKDGEDVVDVAAETAVDVARDAEVAEIAVTVEIAETVVVAAEAAVVTAEIVVVTVVTDVAATIEPKDERAAAALAKDVLLVRTAKAVIASGETTGRPEGTGRQEERDRREEETLLDPEEEGVVAAGLWPPTSTTSCPSPPWDKEGRSRKREK